MALKIYTCPEWGARPPAAEPTLVKTSTRIIFHHTAGHHPEISLPGDESEQEAFRYAQAIQAYHMSQGWNDSGHNFLVCRNGMVLQGRWMTVAAIQQRRMVVSAHCPGQNDQIGIEHEHQGGEEMTAVQREASAQLQAWIARKYGRRGVLPVYPHSRFYQTACPANLAAAIPPIRARAQTILNQET